jgi:hypothetical protein
MGLEPKYFPYVVGLLSIGYGLGNGQTFLAIAGVPPNPLEKIEFSLGSIDENGLIGPETGKRSQAYEFCIPPQKKIQVLAIDPSLQFSQSPGRIKCSQQELLCIGETHQPNWRAILFGLARLDYIAKIIPHWGE